MRNENRKEPVKSRTTGSKVVNPVNAANSGKSVKSKTESVNRQLSFLFTEKGFFIEERDGDYIEEIRPWKTRFEKDQWEALYALGFEKRPKWLDTAGCFLYQVAVFSARAKVSA